VAAKQSCHHTKKRSPFSHISTVEAFNPKNLPKESEEEQFPRQSTESKERPWPLISSEEHRFIEDSGGEYRGFVDQASGEKQFEDVLVNRGAYYDQNLRTVVQIFVTTEAVNEENNSELEGPGAVKGFSTLIVCRSRSGETLEQPQIIHMHSENFPNTPMDAQELRSIAHQVHRFVVHNIGHSRLGELKTGAEAYLSQNGWAKAAR
jgi:hypothetical protein